MMFQDGEIAPPIRNGFCVYPRGNRLIVTESRSGWNGPDATDVFLHQSCSRLEIKKRNMFPVGCFGGLACLGIQD